MTTSPAVLFSFSGYTQSGRTTTYQEVERLFRKTHSDQPLVFLGNILGILPDPPGAHATTRLLLGWARLNEACITRVRPALQEGYCVVVDGFGLDVYLNAVNCHDCPEQIKEAYHLHHHRLVPARVIDQGILPPVYLLPRKHWRTSGAVDMRNAREEREIAAYFKKEETKQNDPFYLDGDTVEARAQEALKYILDNCQQLRATA